MTSLTLPVARFSYTQCDNDRQLMRAAQDVMEQILHAAGADEVITIDRYAHLVGGARKARLLGTAVTALLGSAGPAAELAAAHGLEVSGHCAPNLHARAAAGVGQASQHEAVNEHESDRAV